MKDVQLGKLIIKKIFESEAALPLSMVLPDATTEDLAALKKWYWSDELSLEPDDAGFKLSVHSYLLRSGGLNILIDTCNGNDKNRIVPFADKLQTDYLEKLETSGVKPEEIDIVLCTHLHCDHVGWNTKLVDGEWVPTFPNARYLFTRKDYEFFAEGKGDELHRDAFEDSVLPIVKAGLADIVESDHVVEREVGAGVWLEDAHGHSEGNCVVYAQDEGELAVFSGDCFHHPILLAKPKLQFFADDDPVQAAISRCALLEKHADTSDVVFPAHFGGTSAGSIVKDGEGYRFIFLE